MFPQMTHSKLKMCGTVFLQSVDFRKVSPDIIKSEIQFKHRDPLIAASQRSLFRFLDRTIKQSSEIKRQKIRRSHIPAS